MTNEQLLTLERHQMQMEAHATIVQWVKYPGTVRESSVQEAYARIAAFHTLAQFAQKPAHDLGE